MNWHTIAKTSKEGLLVTGVILEAEDGAVPALALEGAYVDTGSAYRVVSDLVAEGTMFAVLRHGGLIRQVKRGPGQPGYVEALLANIRPPLAPGPRGSFSRLDPPHVLCRRVWGVVGPPETECPPVTTLRVLAARAGRTGLDRTWM